MRTQTLGLAFLILIAAAILGGSAVFTSYIPKTHTAVQQPRTTSEKTATTTATTTLSENEQTARDAAVADVPLESEEPEQETAPEVEEVPTPEPAETTIVAQTTTTQPTPQPSVEYGSAFYTTPKMSLDTVNTITMPAVVNILCAGKQNGPVSGATGSGVIIDSRGIILTNAHVAQYLLVSEHESNPTSCVIRTGAPARNAYTAEVIAFPLAWTQKHAQDINAEEATGTGEHDWALLYITGTTDGSEKPTNFPTVQFDERQAVATTEGAVLIAGYPAGFLGGATLRKDLWPTATVVVIQKVFTFVRTTIDVLSLGGNIAAQAGVSGAAVMNEWGQLVGIIATSSVGDTTDERDLRAITLSHISASVQEQTGHDLHAWLQAGNFDSRVEAFQESQIPQLLTYFPI